MGLNWQQWGDGVSAPVSQPGYPAWIGGWGWEDPEVLMGNWNREVVWVIDVSDSAKRGDIQLQVQLQLTGDNGIMAGGFTVWADVQFTLTQTPNGFRPEDARDDIAVSRCTGNPGDNCRPSFTAHANNWSVSPSAANVSYDFTLDHPSQIARQPVTGWLKGSSTNWGTDDVNFPDYIFDTQTDVQLTPPDQGGLRLTSIASVDTSQDVKVAVKSRDYGGSAILKPKAIISGPSIVGGKVTVAFNVVDENGNDVKAPDCVAAADFARHPFASLPVDQDCNGIADDWEANYLGQGNHYEDPKADDEPGALGGATPDAYKGDGFAVFDEYRGFHMLDDQGNTVWQSTDPTTQDLFYWDASSIVRDQQDNHLQNVFGAQAGGFIALHRVNGEQANATDPNNPSKALRALNSNSPFIDSRGPQGFAVVYVKDNSLRPGTLGDAGNPDDAGDATAYRNAGAFPIRVSPKNIKDKASSVWAGNSSAYAATLLDEVLAHETGHRLSRRHRERVATGAAYDEDGIHGLALGQFMQNPVPKHLDELFLAESIYALSTAAGFQRNEIEEDEEVLSVVPPNVALCCDLAIGRPKPPVWTYRFRAQPKQLVSSATIQSQDGTIMCAKPELDHTQDSQWMFAPDDLNGLCLNAKGCQ